MIKNNDSQKEQVSLRWEKRKFLAKIRLNSLSRLFPSSTSTPPITPQENLIKERIKITEELGEQTLWNGYKQPGGKRTSQTVSTPIARGRFYAFLVLKLKPKIIVEFGSAFGISGMYWLAALEANKSGHLYTYEINKKWSDIANENLKTVGKRFTLTNGLFEEAVDETVDQQLIDIAFIDGVHTSKWVIPQYELVVKRANKKAIIILDDISFSKDMEACWKKLSQEDIVESAVRLNERVGIIQLR